MSDYLDDDGYPTDEALERVKSWTHNDQDGWRGLLDFIKPIWQYAECGYWNEVAGIDILDRPCVKLHLSTAGWSGNESIVGALKDNVIFWMMCWEQSRRGGHYIFELSQARISELKP